MDTQNRSTSNHYTDLGTIDYGECLDLQKRVVKQVKLGRIGNTVMFLKHPPTYTIGRKAESSNYTGIDPVRTERGGDVTYHGPGQVVVYFVFDTRVHGRRDVGRLLRSIENAVQSSLEKQNCEIHIGEEPGFWNGDRKIGSLGMAMDDYVSFHGVSINTGPEVLDGFRKINPCGLNPDVMSYVRIDEGLFRSGLLESLSTDYGRFSGISLRDFTRVLSHYESMPTSQIFS